jgi:hypothetical protein
MLVQQGKTATLGKLYAHDIPFFAARGCRFPAPRRAGRFGSNVLVFHDELVTTEFGPGGQQRALANSKTHEQSPADQALEIGPLERDVHDVASLIRQLDHVPDVRRLTHRRSAECELAFALGQFGFGRGGGGLSAHAICPMGLVTERLARWSVLGKSMTGIYTTRGRGPM